MNHTHLLSLGTNTPVVLSSAIIQPANIKSTTMKVSEETKDIVANVIYIVMLSTAMILFIVKNNIL